MVKALTDIFMFAGIGIFLLAAAALVRPLPILLRSRKAAVLGLCLSFASCSVGASLMPRSSVGTEKPANSKSAPAPVSVSAPTPAEATAPPPTKLSPRKVADADVGSVDAKAAAGQFDVGVLRNDDGTRSLWARAYISANNHYDYLEQGGEAAVKLFDWCRTLGKVECRGVREAYLWLQKMGQPPGDLGLIIEPKAWTKAAVSPADALSRAKPLSGDHYGRAALGVWCRVNREEPRGFCEQARALMQPVPFTN